MSLLSKVTLMSFVFWDNNKIFGTSDFDTKDRAGIFDEFYVGGLGRSLVLALFGIFSLYKFGSEE